MKSLLKKNLASIFIFSAFPLKVLADNLVQDREGKAFSHKKYLQDIIFLETIPRITFFLTLVTF